MSSTQDEYFEVVPRRESIKQIFMEMKEDIDLVMVGSEDEIAMPVLKKTMMDLEKTEHNLKDFTPVQTNLKFRIQRCNYRFQFMKTTTYACLYSKYKETVIIIAPLYWRVQFQKI